MELGWDDLLGSPRRTGTDWLARKIAVGSLVASELVEQPDPGGHDDQKGKE